MTVPPGRAPSSDVVDAAVDELRQGRVVGLPTETVYGLAARADVPEALRRLIEAKGTTDDRPFTLHVAWAPGRGASGVREGSDGRDTGSSSDLRSGAAHAGLPPVRLLEESALPALVTRLASRYWPGPLTLVLRSTAGDGVFGGLDHLSHDGWTGFRAPAHPVTEAILAASPFPVVMTSANPAGGDPAVRGDELRRSFDARTVPLVVDAGPTPLGDASTVLAVGPGRFEVLREGIVAEAEARRSAGLSLLFVCTGNTCRSPMAEALARAALRAALGVQNVDQFGFAVASAGVYAGPGAPVSENSVRAVHDVNPELASELASHRSRPAIDREVAATDRVYCLTAGHRDALCAILPPSAADTIQLLDPTGNDIPDPFGGPLDVYRATRDAISAAIEARLVEWV